MIMFWVAPGLTLVLGITGVLNITHIMSKGSITVRATGQEAYDNEEVRKKYPQV